MTTIDHRPHQQYVTDDKCAKRREACPARKDSKWADRIQGLAIVLVLGCCGISSMSLMASNDNSSRLSAQEAVNEFIVDSLKDIKLTLKEMHPPKPTAPEGG